MFLSSFGALFAKGAGNVPKNGIGTVAKKLPIHFKLSVNANFGPLRHSFSKAGGSGGQGLVGANSKCTATIEISEVKKWITVPNINEMNSSSVNMDLVTDPGRIERAVDLLPSLHCHSSSDRSVLVTDSKIVVEEQSSRNATENLNKAQLTLVSFVQKAVNAEFEQFSLKILRPDFTNPVNRFLIGRSEAQIKRFSDRRVDSKRIARDKRGT